MTESLNGRSVNSEAHFVDAQALAVIVLTLVHTPQKEVVRVLRDVLHAVKTHHTTLVKLRVLKLLQDSRLEEYAQFVRRAL